MPTSFPGTRVARGNSSPASAETPTDTSGSEPKTGKGCGTTTPPPPKAASGPTSPASADLSGDLYALACDKAGRIWAGGLSGVSVYNGKEWRQYGPTDGPLGTRLFALAVSPKDGGVWGATEAGLFRYQNNRWTYYTRANGLPSDQAQALAFAPDGTLYVGTQCDGIAVGSPDDDYHTWRVTPGPHDPPASPAGRGLPTDLINCLLVAKDGTVYAGTPDGLAQSRDSGDEWHYTRGADWKAKLAGLLHPVAPVPAAVPGDLLTEDYVTCLAQDSQGRLFVGHRQTGLEVLDPTTGKRVQSGVNAARFDSYIFALCMEGNAAWVGLYGGGLLPPPVPNAPASNAPAPASVAESVAEAAAPPLPTPAAPPTLAELHAMLARVKSLTGEMPVGGGAYLGEDWRTQGDWVGRYGRQYAVLCAVASPMDQVLTWDSHYAVEGQIGPHHDQDDALRHWIQPGMVNTPRLASLYSPVDGFRVEATWDDHSETYPFAYDGPDVWVTVTVPEGIHRVSLYVTNKDGHNVGAFTYRDYPVDLLPYREKVEDAEKLTPLAHTRIANFWNGMYKSFVVRGPAKYYIRLGRNNSFCTLLAGVLVDKLTGPPALTDNDPLCGLNGTAYDPPDPDISQRPFNLPPLPPLHLSQTQRQTLSAARTLWTALTPAYDKTGSSALQQPYRLLAYRAALVNGGSDELGTNWRWALHLWTDEDRQWFDRVMQFSAQRDKSTATRIITR